MLGPSKIKAGQSERGFTLVELVIVIALLGVLAAVALPRWGNIQGEARAAKADSLAGAIRNAAAQGKGVALARGVSCSVDVAAASSPVVVEGAAIGLRFCYPMVPASAAAPAGSIIQAANIDPTLDRVTLVVFGTAPNLSVDVRMIGATDPVNCRVRYTAPTAASGLPTVSVVKTGC